MKITILCPNLASNALGRAYILAKMLSTRYDLEILGPAFGAEIWRSVAFDSDIPVRALAPREIVSKSDGDILLASKPLYHSFGLALRARNRQRRPLILDIDDWELGFIRAHLKRLGRVKRIRKYVADAVRPVNLFSAHSYWNAWLGERLVRRADAITVSNHFLQQRFGGQIIWHARDGSIFRPPDEGVEEYRENLDLLPGDRVIMFSGTPRAHKGLEILIDAVERMHDPQVKLVLLGRDRDPYCLSICDLAEKTLRDRFIVRDLVPYHQVPKYLAVADVVVIPQRRSPASVGQVPAKVFDAMAAARPIVATSVGDLPYILDGCGWIVEPGDSNAMAAAIRWILDHPGPAQKRALVARRRFEELFDMRVVGRKLLDIVESALPCAGRGE